jgi:hypothetical protein
MTKNVRIENADTSDYRVIIERWRKGFPPGDPDILVSTKELSRPTSMDTFTICSDQWLVVKELPAAPVLRSQN